MKKKMANIYQENGFADRNEYLESLSDDYGVPIETIITISSLLGESEDFDGLISTLEDSVLGLF